MVMVPSLGMTHERRYELLVSGLLCILNASLNISFAACMDIP